MDQIKIGEFISSQRKEKALTQAALAEMLGITDRAVSKWERGKSLPDASIMLDLCRILGITVNELLKGEKIEMENFEKKTEELLVELAKAEEEKNKSLMLAMWVLLASSITALLTVCVLAKLFIEEGALQTAVVLLGVVVFLIPCFYALKLEVKAGYYECKNCHHKFVPTYTKALNAMHMSTTRFLKCPNCNERHWCKKVMKK